MRNSRYQQLSNDQRARLTNTDKGVAIEGGLSSFTGRRENLKHFEIALKQFKSIVDNWPTRAAWIHAFIKRCDDQSMKSKRGYETVCSQFKNGFATFLEQRSQTGLELSAYSSELINEYHSWLRTDTSKKTGVTAGDREPRSETTARKYFQSLRLLIAQLQNDKDYAGELQKLIFPNIAFSGSAASENKYELLDDIAYRALYRGCRALAEETVKRIQFAQSVFNSESVGVNTKRWGRGKYAALPALLCALKSRYPCVLPNQGTIRKADKSLCGAIQYIHGGYRVVQEYFQPNAETILPFVILMSIYTDANTGPLRSLRQGNIIIAEIMGCMRVLIEFEKGRGQYSYRRSYALDDADILSPNKILNIIKLWTAQIREAAEDEAANNVFIFVSQQGRVRSFLTAVDYGTDSDSSWKNALNNLCKRLGLDRLNNSQLRFTGLDIVREATNDDIRAVKAAGGQKAESTIKLHYEGAGATRRRNETLAEAMLTEERWVGTGGKSDFRGTPDDAELTAATPGWGCVDPFDSPIPGETHGKLCQAFGSCPACPNARLGRRSAYSLSRILQLRDEVSAAVEYLDTARWKATYEKVAIALRNKWIPSFDDVTVWQAASQLNLGPIGRLE